MKMYRFLLGLAWLGLAATANAATEFYVSPTGNDAADGTKEALKSKSCRDGIYVVKTDSGRNFSVLFRAK